MTRQGRCVLPADEAGRVLDRLAGLEKIITPALVRQVLWDTKRWNQRACVLTHEVMLWVVLAMGILTDLPIRQVFKHARRLRAGEAAPHRSSLCVARRRLGIAPLRRLFQEVVHPLAGPDTPEAFYRGLRLMGIEGTDLRLPPAMCDQTEDVQAAEETAPASPSATITENLCRVGGYASLNGIGSRPCLNHRATSRLFPP